MWEHREASRLLTLNAVLSDICIYCSNSLIRLPSQSYQSGEKRLLFNCPFADSVDGGAPTVFIKMSILALPERPRATQVQ